MLGAPRSGAGGAGPGGKRNSMKAAAPAWPRYLVDRRRPEPYHSRARIETFQVLAAAFPAASATANTLHATSFKRVARGEWNSMRAAAPAPAPISRASKLPRAIPFPGANPVFPRLCGAISGPTRSCRPALAHPRSWQPATPPAPKSHDRLSFRGFRRLRGAAIDRRQGRTQAKRPQASQAFRRSPLGRQ